MVTVGTHPSCSINIPLIHSFIDKLDLLNIGQNIEILIPPGMRASLIEENNFTPMTSPKHWLQQKQLIKIELNESISLLIRPSQTTIKPRLIPIVDVSSNGFLSVGLAIAITLILALFVKLNPSPESATTVEEFYPTQLIIQSPQRIAEILKIPPINKNIKVKSKKSQKLPPSKKTTKISKSAGNNRPSSGLKLNKNSVKNTAGSIQKGKSIKQAKNQGAQAKSPNIKNSKLFAALSNFGRRSEIDKNYDGAGELAGLADKATGSAGESVSREGEKFGSRFKTAGSRKKGQSNIGVEGLSKGGGKGPGFGTQSIGERKSVSINPQGTGAIFSGQIDREGIRKVFFDNASVIRSCYERVLNQSTKLAGKIILNFDIGPGGQVVGRPGISQSGSTIQNPQLSQCLTNRLKTWRFPDPPAGQTVNVLYPLAFSSR